MAADGDREATRRVVMTGAGGYLGAHLLAQMVGSGMDVTLIGPDAGESRYTASLVTSGAVRFVRCDADFADEDALRTAVEEAQAIVLLGQVMRMRSSVAESILSELERNVAPIIRILHASDGRANHVVFASSVAIYGSPQRVPVRESDSPCPSTPYGIAKLAAEHAVRVTCSAVGMTASILRYATVYGPGETARHALPEFIHAALTGKPTVIDGDGHDEHDYIHVADAVEGTLAALRHRADGVYNIGTGVGTTTLDLARLVNGLCNATTAPVRRTWTRDGHTRARIVCDTELAGRHFGFTARRALVDGITEEISWLKNRMAGTPQAALAFA